MRDDPPRVGRPRKGTQRKSRERSERYKSANIQNAFQLDYDEDLQIPSDSRGNRRIASPLNVLTSPTSISSTAMSMDSASSDINQYEENDVGLASQGAVCAFCNCGSEMAQILGQISRYYPSPDFDPFKCEDVPRPSHSGDPYMDRLHEKSKETPETIEIAPLRIEKRSVGRPPGRRKKLGKHPMIRQLTADMLTFGAATRPETSDVFDADGCLWAHHCCAAWSAGVCQTDSYDLENVDKAAFKAISEQCCHCRRHGASVECQIQKCTKLYHYPCCASAGAFQDIKSMVLLCPDHLDHATRLAGSEASCVLCDKTGDIAKQLFCTSCGRHYHGKCLDPPVSISSIVRMGWQCPECKVCQGCRQPGDDEKMLFCDECDKGFHTYCLSPPMTSVPKTAWKCYRCRKCEDCGSNVPGSGPSCRWHFNYTVCDRCYQQRKKTTLQCCPMCGKAIRHISGDQNKQCMKCTSLIHIRCDKEMGYEMREYYCPNCRKNSLDDDSEFSGFIDNKEESNDSLLLSPVHSSTNDLDAEYLGQRTVTIAEAEAISRTATGFLHREPSPLLKHSEMEDLDLKGMDINFDEVMMESGLHGPLMHDLDELKPDSSDSFSSPPHISSSASYSHQFSSSDDRQHLPRVTSSVSARATRGKKKMSPFRCRGRPPGSAGRGKKSKGQRGGRPRSKSTSTSGPNKENIQAGQVATTENNKKDEDADDAEGLHSTVIMVSTRDTFSLGQDICMCCGSFGKGSEGHLIACAHCGQCFHPYCVNIKINKVLMTKGWRCLDCTVCEGCGKNEDEGKLLLCDGCDISYHIYCLDPPLEQVPPDGWKCQWCVECVSCGATTPGAGCKWMASYTQCGPCASEGACCVCNKTYLDDELVIKCTHCSRWLHADCDGLVSEDDSELAASYGYHCCLCRETTGHFGIFSSSWTKVVEKGVYTSTNKQTNTQQTVIVTQTTTTVMATGVSNRKAKALGSVKPNRSPLMKPNSRLPLHPVQTSVQGTFEVKLPGLRVKARREDIIESDSVSLTEKGLRQIKSMIVKAPVRGYSRAKDRPSKQSSSDVKLGERETKTSGQLTKTTACSEDIGESRQPVCLASGTGEAEEYQPESETENRNVLEKRMPGRPPNDKRADSVKWKKGSDKRDDPVDFFGTSLLKISRKKRKKDSQTDNDTQSSEDESNKQEHVKPSKHQPTNQPGQLSRVPQYSELEMTKQQASSATGSQHGSSWPSKIPAGMAVDPLSDEIQHSESLYKTLNMLVSGPEDVENQPGRELQHDQHQSEQKRQHYGSSKQHSAGRHGALNEHNTDMGQNTDLTPTGDLDLIGLSDLPHVEGHEVEEIFAGIEREMSVDGTPRSQDQSPMEATLNDYPKSESSSFSREQLKSAENKPIKFQGTRPPSVSTSVDPALTPGYTDQQPRQRVQLSQPEYRQYDMYRPNPSFQPPYDQRVGQPKPIGAETDAFKAVFGEEPEIKSKSRDGASSPKIDGQKQLKKWEQDEKLGDLATISPVLYANIVHPKLKIDYPEWPNRARAIARLWRKLPQEQREPFRLRARDNRVKQKDQGRKLGNFKKPLSTPTTDVNISFSNASPSLSSDSSDKVIVQSMAETTAIDVLSSNLMLNGEASSTTMIRTPAFPQDMAQSFVYKEGRQFSDASPGYSQDSNHSFAQGDHNVFRPNHGQFMTGGGDEPMHDPMLVQTRTSSVVSPSIASLQKSQQSLGRSSGRPSSDSSKPFSLSDLCSPTTPSELHFPATGLTPTTPVFPSSPFQSSPYGTEAAASPRDFISPSLPVEGNQSEKKRSKKQSKASKEQLDIDREKKKKKLAIDQEKERQWKVLQQQRLKEQQVYQQTPAIQQVLMMKEQMRKDNNKPNRKSQINLPLEHDNTSSSLRSNVLPPVEPFTLTPTKNLDDKFKLHKSESITSPAAGLVPVSSNINQPSKGILQDIPDPSINIPSSFASHMDYFKDDIHILTDQASINKALFLTSVPSKDTEGHLQSGASSGKMSTDVPSSALDRLLEISNAEFAKMSNDRAMLETENQNTNRSKHHSVVSTNTSTGQHWVSSASMSNYTTSPSFPMQTSADDGSQAKMPSSKDHTTDFHNNKDSTPVDSAMLNQSLSMTLPEHQVVLPDVASQGENQPLVVGKNNQPIKPGFSLPPPAMPPAMPPVPGSVPDNLEKPAGFEQQQQQQALLFQQQQFMAAQQQYIQWQLQQRNPELFQSVSTPIQYSSYTDKDLPEVDSEEQHQERIRFLYRQRQMQKQQVVQMQQQLQQQQQLIAHTSSNPVRPQIDAQQQLMQQLLQQQQQQTPEALQQQVLLEYNRQMQHRTDTGQNVMQYDKFLAELAQQYGYTMQQSNAHNAPVVPHGMNWQGSTSQNMHPTAQQMFGYGIDEEKAKELTPQQLYQLQLQHTLIMHQMAASGIYQPQSTSRNQSPIPSGSRKGSTGSSQERSKKSKEVKKGTSVDKSTKLEPQQGPGVLQEASKPSSVNTKSRDSSQAHSATESLHGSPSATLFEPKSSTQENAVGNDLEHISSMSSSSKFNDALSPLIPVASTLAQASNRETHVIVGSSGSIAPSNTQIGVPLSRKEVEETAEKLVKRANHSIQMQIPHEMESVIHHESSGNNSNVKKDKTVAEIMFNDLSKISVSKPEVVNSVVQKNNPKFNYHQSDAMVRVAMRPGEENCNASAVAQQDLSKTFPAGAEETTNKVVCNDGIHCGTDSEDESGNDRHGFVLGKSGLQDNRAGPNPNTVCSDGIHCGTDSEDEGYGRADMKASVRTICSDGVHCGTDSEDEGCDKEVFSNNTRAVCSDGIHCGTDSEDESQSMASERKPELKCTDGIHCGTDSEDGDDESGDLASMRGIKQEKSVCSDGIHCGTDSEGEDELSLKDTKQGKLSDTVTNNSNDEPKKAVCSDGIHCGTDSENEEEASKDSSDQKALRSPRKSDSNIHPISSESQGGGQPGNLPKPIASSSLFSPDHTLEVIQEGDVTANAFNALESMDISVRESKSGDKLHGSGQGSFNQPSHDEPTPSAQSIIGLSNVKNEQKGVPTCIYKSQNVLLASHQRPELNVPGRTQITQPPKMHETSFSLSSSVAQSFQTSHAMTNELLRTTPVNKTTTVLPASKMPQPEAPSQQPSSQQSMPSQIFSPNPSSSSSVQQHQDVQAQSRSRPKFVGIQPSSPQYQQVFLHQHQLLIMQFQQYQYQLQAQFQQLSQQQMSPQQQFLLQQQYHQQIMLLQRQFVQQQTQLQAMASAGMQFTEQELNVMYQQQMVAQQAYNHWIATLSLDQQGQLHTRMQANMQQVQQAMAAVMQNTAKNAPETGKDKSRKPRGRRPRKTKTEPSDPATPAPNTPSLPPTPASAGDPTLPSTPNKDQVSTPDLVNRNRNLQLIYPTAAAGNNMPIPEAHSFPGSSITSQESSISSGFLANRSQGQVGDSSQVYTGNKAQNIPSYNQSQNTIDQHLMQIQGRDWQQIGSDPRQILRQQQADITMQQQQQQSQHAKLPRVDIVPEGSNPFSDVYQEMEKKSKTPNQMPVTQPDSNTGSSTQGAQPYGQDPWKGVPTEELRQTGSGSSTPRMTSTSMHSGSAFYYPSPTGNPPSIPAQPSQAPVYSSKSRGHVPSSLPQGNAEAIRLYSEQLASKHSYENNQTQYFDPSREHLRQEAQNSPLQSASDVNQSQVADQITNVAQYSAQSSIMSHLDNPAPPYNSHAVMGHAQRPGVVVDDLQSSQWGASLSGTGSEPSYAHATQSRQPAASRIPGATNVDLAQPQNLPVQPQPGTQLRVSGVPNERLMPPPKYDSTTVKSPLPYPMNLSQQSQTSKPDLDPSLANPSRVANMGSVPTKDQSKAMQKRKRGGQPSQLQSTSVDFSLLNPEEQKKFILERKREDFERRRRIVEEQKQLKLKEQRNFKTANRKIEKKVPRTKQRKLKGGRDKLPADKSPIPSRIVLDDKSLKLPLCEPEVHLLYPLVQPYGSGYTNGDTMLFGVFGNALVQGTSDYYAQFPSPDPPVTSSNPPTPPASLPPSPGTINQSLRDSLQMIPTEGIFDDLAITKRPKDDLSLFGADLDRQGAFYSATGRSSSSAERHSKDSKDDVMVTLTMSKDDRRTAKDRVSNVTDILGVAKPGRIHVVDEKKPSIDRVEGSNIDSAEPRPLATSIGKEKDVHFSCLESEKRSNDPEKNKAPFCKHCDISIQGTGYTECKDGYVPADSMAIKVENRTFKKITIDSRRELFDVFCSQLCLKSYHSLSKPAVAGALISDPSGTDDSGQLIDPIRSVIPVSTGDPSSADFSRTGLGDSEIRGSHQAQGSLSSGITRRRSLNAEHDERNTKRSRSVIWKRWRITFSPKPGKKDSVQSSVIELLEKYGAALKAEKDEKDYRECMLCGEKGDGITEGTARLINYDVDVWVHLNCALWSLEVYETLNGALHNVQKAYERGIQTACVYCSKKGATVTCARVIGSQMRRCDMNYHFNCAINAHCTFFKDKTVLCPQHKNYGTVDQRLPSYAVLRKVYVNRDITKQLASVLRMNNEEERRAYTMRIGSLIFHELGQLLPHQLQRFHTKEAIYPVGFQTTRIYWSTSRLGRRCRYVCTVSELDKNPHFTVSVEDGKNKVGQYAGSTPKEVWSYILEPIRKIREETKMVKIFPEFMTGEDIFGLTDPSLQRIIESLPGVDTLHDYSFRFGRTPIIMAELPLAVNPTGCIRSESTRHIHLNRPVSLRTASSAPSERADRADSSADDNSQGSMLRNNWAMTKTAQYRKLKSDWKNIVLLSKSRIQGLGLFATRDIDPNTMIIEYIGSMIRNEVANKRERIYEDGNRGVYMFRVDPETVIDATMTGGPARYINHSCDPNCVAEVVVIEKMPKIIIISNRKIEQGEELTYDYKFEFEDDQHKIACLCGAANCRKWMN